MAIDPRYIADSSLQQYLSDKDSGEPMIGGQVFFYKDKNRSEAKPVYKLAGNQEDYTFVALPNPLQIGPAGTLIDGNGNDVNPYYFPFEEDNGVIQELYFVVVQNATGVNQFTREAWPPGATDDFSPDFDGLVVANLIPNGQFLDHNNLKPTSEVEGGSTTIARGGWTFEVTDPTVSVNEVEFLPIVSWTDDPPQSPPFEVRVNCTVASAADMIKRLRIRFRDVNKFANNRLYSFGFSARSDRDLNVRVNSFKFFGTGGSASVDETKAEFTVKSDQDFYAVTFDFGDNAGAVIGDDSYIAIDIAFPEAIPFEFIGTDFILFPGAVPLNGYPSQTDADTLTRTVPGWMDLPDADGGDLFLPLILTPQGMQFDRGQIGNIETTALNVTPPDSTSPLPSSNVILCDGSSYIYEECSALGIPYSRLGDALLDSATAATPDTPRYGTGKDYVTCAQYFGVNTTNRLTVNSNGSPISGATDGDTGWDIGSVIEYGGSITGSDSLGYTAYSRTNNNVYALGNFDTPNAAADAATSGFSITLPSSDTGFTAFNNYSLSIGPTDAASLADPGNPGKYWLFSNDTTDYYMWFQITTETDPAVGGRTAIKVNLDAAYTTRDVASLILAAMNAYQCSDIAISGLPAAGSHWLFSANPSSVRNFYVWYTVDGAGTDPAIGGRIGLQVPLLSTDTDNDIRNKNRIVINKYQFAVPDYQGVFLRGNDPGQKFDNDVNTRLGEYADLNSSNLNELLGTLQLDQLRGHNHQIVIGEGGGGPDSFSYVSKNTFFNDGQFVLDAGGSETRAVNVAVNFVIRY